MSLDFKVDDLYVPSDVVSNLQLVHFYTSRSLWTDGDKLYMFKHHNMGKVKFSLEKIVPDKIQLYFEDVYNCCSPARLG